MFVALHLQSRSKTGPRSTVQTQTAAGRQGGFLDAKQTQRGEQEMKA